MTGVQTCALPIYSDGYGIPREFDCFEEDYIKDPLELVNMSDEQLLEAYESAVGFAG